MVPSKVSFRGGTSIGAWGSRSRRHHMLTRHRERRACADRCAARSCVSTPWCSSSSGGRVLDRSPYRASAS